MQPVPSSSRPFLRVPRRIQIGLFWCTIAVPTACAHGVESDLVLLEDAAARSTGQTTGSLAGVGAMRKRGRVARQGEGAADREPRPGSEEKAAAPPERAADRGAELGP